MTEIQIRLAAPADATRVRAIAQAAYAEFVPVIGREPAPMIADFDAQIAAGEVEVYVSEADGRVNGYIVCYPRGDHLMVENVAVEPATQGGGIGRALLAFAEAEARRHRLTAIELYTHAKMTRNLAFYPRLGFVETGRRREDGFDRVHFRRELATQD